MTWNTAVLSFAGLCLLLNFAPLAAVADEARRGRWDDKSAAAAHGLLAMVVVLCLMVER